jgi:cytochrome c biogenesis protein CcmG/thiol:disulfide interchange protein DsbE
MAPADFDGQVWLLNVWATWCAACEQEHPVLMRAAREHGLTLVGLDYKDERAKAIEWLDRRGDPYVVSGFDPEGRVGLDLGVYGAPETYIIDAEGVVRYKHIGPISPKALREDILPRVRDLRESA